ncbi:colicin immunity domain-containing protein [Rahnella aceris]
MSQKLLTFARSFINGEISAEDFADPYQMLWKAEGYLRHPHPASHQYAS